MGEGLWTYPTLVPDFNISAVTVVDVIVSLTDADNTMSNSSRVVRVQPKTNSTTQRCVAQRALADFVFYPTGNPIQCLSWLVTWNNSANGNWTPPLTLFFLPENQPAISVPITVDNAAIQRGWGTNNLSMALRAGTTFFFTMTDSGSRVTGGVSNKNIVGLDENFATDACLDTAYNSSTGIDDKVPRPTTTVSVAGSSGLPASYMTQSTVTSGQETFIATQTVLSGTPLPGWDVQRIDTGSPDGNGSGFGTQGVVGVAVGIGVLLGLLGAGIVYLCWRRKNKKKRRSGGITKWDVPNDAQHRANLPVHHGVYAGTSDYNRQGSFNTFQSATGTSTDGAGREGSVRGSPAGTGGGTAATAAGAATAMEGFRDGEGSSQGQGRAAGAANQTELQDFSASRARRPYWNGSDPASLDLTDRDAAGLTRFNTGPENRDSGSSAGGIDPPSPISEGGKPGQRVGPGPTYRSPFAYAQSSPGNSLPSSPSAFHNISAPGSRQPLLAHDGSPRGASTFASSRPQRSPRHVPSEWGQFTNREPRSQNGSSASGSGNYQALSNSTGSQQGGTTRFVQHADAGLLMNDEVDAQDPMEESMVVDLPPQYDTISATPAARRDLRRQAEAYASQQLSRGGVTSQPAGAASSSSSNLISPDLIASLEQGGTISSANSVARGRPLLDELAGDGDDDDGRGEEEE